MACGMLTPRRCNDCATCTLRWMMSWRASAADMALTWRGATPSLMGGRSLSQKTLSVDFMFCENFIEDCKVCGMRSLTNQ